ncbi:hypothetical protein MKEN_01374900 [Mycena kentingensis (nom. inval.)]|nr:hypothetical protein MKEN_01374900 [Mycena kentingensis (nom. inval.)]
MGVGLLFGPFLAGLGLNLVLYGIMASQMLAYYRRYHHDLGWIRFFLLYLFFAETAAVLIQLGIVWEPLVTRFGTEDALRFVPKLLPGDPLTLILVSTPIQMFTAWRIKEISGSWRLSAGIAFLSFASFCGGLTTSILMVLHKEFTALEKYNPQVVLSLVSTLLCDSLIAVGMMRALYKRRTGSHALDADKAVKILRLVMETGSVTAFAAFWDFVLYLAKPVSHPHFAIGFPLSTISICSLLTMLNSRSTEPPVFIDLEAGQPVVSKPKMHMAAPGTLPLFLTGGLSRANSKSASHPHILFPRTPELTCHTECQRFCAHDLRPSPLKTPQLTPLCSLQSIEIYKSTEKHIDTSPPTDSPGAGAGARMNMHVTRFLPSLNLNLKKFTVPGVGPRYSRRTSGGRAGGESDSGSILPIQYYVTSMLSASDVEGSSATAVAPSSPASSYATPSPTFAGWAVPAPAPTHLALSLPATGLDINLDAAAEKEAEADADTDTPTPAPLPLYATPHGSLTGPGMALPLSPPSYTISASPLASPLGANFSSSSSGAGAGPTRSRSRVEKMRRQARAKSISAMSRVARLPPRGQANLNVGRGITFEMATPAPAFGAAAV